MDVEFRDIHFHYPEQPAEKGLKGVSFTVKAGTTTAIVGHTGAGNHLSSMYFVVVVTFLLLQAKLPFLECCFDFTILLRVAY